MSTTFALFLSSKEAPLLTRISKNINKFLQPKASMIKLSCKASPHKLLKNPLSNMCTLNHVDLNLELKLSPNDFQRKGKSIWGPFYLLFYLKSNVVSSGWRWFYVLRCSLRSISSPWAPSFKMKFEFHFAFEWQCTLCSW